MRPAFVRRWAFLLLSIRITDAVGYADGSVTVTASVVEDLGGGFQQNRVHDIDAGVITDAKHTRLLRAEAQAHDAASKPYLPAQEGMATVGLLTSVAGIMSSGHDELLEIAADEASQDLRMKESPPDKDGASSPAPATSQALNLITSTEKPSEASPGWLVLNFNSKCVQYHPNGAWPLKATTCKPWQLQKFYFDGEKIRAKEDSKCVDHNTTDNKIHLSQCHQGANQKWQITSAHQVKSLSTSLPGKCLEYDTHDNHLGAVILKTCTSNALQEWKFKKQASSRRRTAVLAAPTFSENSNGGLEEAASTSRTRDRREAHARNIGHHVAMKKTVREDEEQDLQDAQTLETELADALEEGHAGVSASAD